MRIDLKTRHLHQASAVAPVAGMQARLVADEGEGVRGHDGDAIECTLAKLTLLNDEAPMLAPLTAP